MREKKWLALGLTAVMTAGMLSACGKEAAQETAETKKEETDGNAAQSLPSGCRVMAMTPPTRRKPWTR